MTCTHTLEVYNFTSPHAFSNNLKLLFALCIDDRYIIDITMQSSTGKSRNIGEQDRGPLYMRVVPTTFRMSLYVNMFDINVVFVIVVHL